MLVVLVIIVFLQKARASIIPVLAIPISLVGTFAVLAVLGYSLNNLSLFGLVLAIGIVVDDAIVVVENVERLMEEEKLSAREATAKSMGQILSALVGINVAQPNYYDQVMGTPVFIPACLVVAGFLIANVFVMKMLVNIKV